MTTEEEALGYYLKPEGKRMSSFWAALRDARCATGRNVETGTVVDEAKTGSWLGAIGYLLLLDQIGTAVRPKRGPGVPAPTGGSSICKALEWFAPHHIEKGRKAIYALRCALAHDYSLFNNHRNDPDMRHEFALHRGEGRVVQLPPISWSGSYTTLERYPTEISLRALGDDIEYVVRRVLDCYEHGDLTIGAGISAEELTLRYSLVTP
jgi:hypothetical protein